MLGREFEKIMKEQPAANLNVYDEWAKIQAQVNQTNLLLREYHANPHPHPGRERQTKEGSC